MVRLTVCTAFVLALVAGCQKQSSKSQAKAASAPVSAQQVEKPQPKKVEKKPQRKEVEEKLLDLKLKQLAEQLAGKDEAEAARAVAESTERLKKQLAAQVLRDNPDVFDERNEPTVVQKSRMKEIKTKVQELATKEKPAEAARILGDKMSFQEEDNKKAKAVKAMTEFFDLIPKVKGMMPKTLAESGVTREMSYGDKVVAYRKAATQAEVLDKKLDTLQFTVTISSYGWELEHYKTNMWNMVVKEWMKDHYWKVYREYRAKLYDEAKALMIPEKAERLLFGSYYDGSNVRLPSKEDQERLEGLFQIMYGAMSQYQKGNEAQKAKAQQAFNQAFGSFVKEDQKKPSFWELNVLLQQSLSAGMRVNWGWGYSLSHNGTALEVKIEANTFEGVDAPKTIVLSHAPAKEVSVSPDHGMAWIRPCEYGGYLGMNGQLTIQTGVSREKGGSTNYRYRWNKKK